MVLYSFINLTSQTINFLNIQRDEQIYFSCLIINEIIYAISIIYGIILCFWSTLTSCWREGNTSNSGMSCTTCCFFIFFIFSNLYIFYSLFIEEIDTFKYLKDNGYIFLSLIGGLIIEGILFSFCRNCISCKSKEKKLLKYKDITNDEIV